MVQIKSLLSQTAKPVARLFTAVTKSIQRCTKKAQQGNNTSGWVVVDDFAVGPTGMHPARRLRTDLITSPALALDEPSSTPVFDKPSLTLALDETSPALTIEEPSCTLVFDSRSSTLALDEPSSALTLNEPSSTFVSDETSSNLMLDEQQELAEIEAEIADFHELLARLIPRRAPTVDSAVSNEASALPTPPVEAAKRSSEPRPAMHVMGTEAFEALLTADLTDSEFKQRLSSLRPGLDLPASPVLSANIREFALLSIENCPTAGAATLGRRIVVQAELDMLMATYASEVNISDAEFRESIQIVKPGFVLPGDSEIPLIARAFALKLLRTEPEMEMEEMIERTCREIRYDAIHGNWKNERMNRMVTASV